MKIAINRYYGGFGINNKVAKILKEKGVNVTFVGEYYKDGSGPKTKFGEEEFHHFSNDDFNIENDNYYAWRTDKRLIDAIEQIGEKQSGTRLSEISIVYIPDNIEWEIDEYDGIETVHEKHRSW